MNQDISSIGETSDQTKKKGRKGKENYFDTREENAVIEYLSTDSPEEKNKIYNEFLRHPLDKMISSIIRRYKLYRKDMEFEDLHSDTHSFLMTKLDKFKPAKEKKAYSYFGTICKNYLMGQIIKDQKEINRKISYEDISTDLENNVNFAYSIDEDIIDSETTIKKFLLEMKNYISKSNLNENEIKLGDALIEIFENYDKLFLSTSNNNKFNKNVILLSLREMTNLSTKEIRLCLKKYKLIYINMLERIIK
jgi:hypothetical protein